MIRRTFQHGFTLVELTIVLTILGLLAAGGLAVSAGMVEKAHYTDTRKLLETIDKTLRDYYVVNGRLPCPASLTALPGTATFGQEAISDCATNTTVPAGTIRTAAPRVRIGMIPVRTLGLTDNAAQDKFGARIRYAVTENLTDSSLFTTNPGVITVLSGSGASITSEAAYAILSHGKDRIGANLYLTGTNPAALSCSGTQLDRVNCNATSTFRDAPFNNGEIAAQWFDDIILWSPRFHLSALGSEGGDSFWANTGPDPQNIFSIGPDGLPDTGNVGIGTGDPQQRLHVRGATYLEPLTDFYIYINKANAPAGQRNWALQDLNNDGKLIFRSRNDDWSFKRTLIAMDHATGNVGINEESPTERLHVSGTALVTGDTTINGNVGIGTTPVASQTLRVAGNARIADSLGINANPPDPTNQRLYVNGPVRIGSRFYIDPDLAYGSGSEETPGTSIYGATGTSAHLTIYAQNNSQNGASISLGGRSSNFWGDGRITYRASYNSSNIRPMHHFYRITSAGVTHALAEIQANANMHIFGNLSQGSDERLKTDIRPIENALEKLLTIQGINYRWAKDSPYDDKEALHLGVIAQKVQKVFPEAVYDNTNGYLSLSYTSLIPVLIEAIRELKTENDSLKAQLTDKGYIAPIPYDPFRDWRIWVLIVGVLFTAVVISRCTARK